MAKDAKSLGMVWLVVVLFNFFLMSSVIGAQVSNIKQKKIGSNIDIKQLLYNSRGKEAGQIPKVVNDELQNIPELKLNEGALSNKDNRLVVIDFYYKSKSSRNYLWFFEIKDMSNPEEFYMTDTIEMDLNRLKEILQKDQSFLRSEEDLEQVFTKINEYSKGKKFVNVSLHLKGNSLTIMKSKKQEINNKEIVTLDRQILFAQDKEGFFLGDSLSGLLLMENDKWNDKLYHNKVSSTEHFYKKSNNDVKTQKFSFLCTAFAIALGLFIVLKLRKKSKDKNKEENIPQNPSIYPLISAT